MAGNAFLIGKVEGGVTSPQTTPTGYTTTAGSTLFAAIAHHNTKTVTSVTDNKSNTYTALGVSGSIDPRTTLYICYDAAGGADHQLTVNWSTDPGNASVLFVEVTGVIAAPLDVNVFSQDASSPFTVVSGTLAQADEILISVCASNSGSNPATFASSNTTILGSSENGTSHWAASVSKLVVSATTSITPSWTSTGGTSANVHVLSFKASSSTLEQEGFRFYNDDGSESGSTALADQDTNVTAPLTTPIRLRMLVNATGDPASAAYKLQYREVGTATWLDVI